jgi:hypothetical protein
MLGVRSQKEERRKKKEERRKKFPLFFPLDRKPPIPS